MKQLYTQYNINQYLEYLSLQFFQGHCKSGEIKKNSFSIPKIKHLKLKITAKITIN